MTPQQIALVRQSWAALGPVATEVATDFYTRLFALDARMATLLAHAGVEAQARKFALAMSALVECLHEPERYVPLLARLGRDHTAIGVSERQYRLFGDVLLTTLGSALHPVWNRELHDAWAETYLLVASIMQRAGARISGATQELPA
jgi:nitric oxide dioxygenase